MKNKYNIGDVLTNHDKTVIFVVTEIISDYEQIKTGTRNLAIITSIRYKLISQCPMNDEMYVSQELIDGLLIKGEQ